MAREDLGVLIAFEGIDGAGKTTQVDLLERFFAAAGESVVRSKEPTDGVWGRQIRASAANGRLPWAAELHALVEDRKEHVAGLICPALAAGRTVILDRYFYSTIAYQGARGGSVKGLTAEMLALFPVPDVTVVIDVPAALGLDRIESGRKEKPNAFEDVANLQAVRQIFLNLSNSQPDILLIDGTTPVDFVHRRILASLIDGVLKKRHCSKAYGCDEPLYCVYRLSNTCRWARMRKAAGLTV